MDPKFLDPDFHIESPRLYIGYLLADSDEHCQFLRDMYNTEFFITQLGKTSIITVEDARKLIGGRFTDQFIKDGHGIYLVKLKTTPETPFEEAKLIGTVSLMKGDTMTAPDVGFAIIPEELRKGYASEAGRAIADYAKNELGIPVVFGFCNPDNTASRKTLAKMGLKEWEPLRLSSFGYKRSAVFSSPEVTDLSVYNVVDSAPPEETKA